MSGTICWYCDNCCGKCSWSKNFTPVDGWTAIEKRDSYEVHDCPEYKSKYTKPLTIDEICDILNLSKWRIKRMSKTKLIEFCNELGFNLLRDNGRYLIWRKSGS